jgi:branched-chain amino acid transport system ATP-binding protein
MAPSPPEEMSPGRLTLATARRRAVSSSKLTDERPATAPLPAAVRNVLELEQVSKRFGRVVVAEQLSLSVGETELLGVVGPNGAGKTSLFSIISGDLAPDEGRVVFDGRLINGLDVASRCRLGIGRTYQVPRPFEKMTVFENVLLAAQAGAGLRGRVANEHTYEILGQTGLAGDANRPSGQLGLLSRKRLELARALATKPRLLLLDEVAAGLTDPEVAELISIVRQARTAPTGDTTMAVVWVEHVVRALVETAERLVCLDGGAIIADGKPEEVLADPSVKQVYLGTEEELIEE